MRGLVAIDLDELRRLEKRYKRKYDSYDADFAISVLQDIKRLCKHYRVYLGEEVICKNGL